MERSEEEHHEIVIVGGGICGLATALALHRKGIRSVVLERSQTLRATGGAIGILANGWRALHQLGVASVLRQTAIPLQGPRDILLDKSSDEEASFWSGEARCLKRSELIKTLADALPQGTICFGCHIVSVRLDSLCSYPILQLLDGRSIVAKVLIGCDGAKSVVADFLGLKPTKEFDLSAVRGLTSYPNGHAFPHEFTRMRRNNHVLVGRAPIDDKSVFWFVLQHSSPKDAKVSQSPELIKESTLEAIDGFPSATVEMIRESEIESLSLRHLRYRAPWALVLGQFRKGTVTVAGDAMHVMGPFLGQGGSAGLEDAVVLARCLSKKLPGEIDLTKTASQQTVVQEIGEAMDEYLKERRTRLLRFSTQTYLIGSLLQPSSSLLLKFACFVLMTILFANPNNHTTYDCGFL